MCCVWSCLRCPRHLLRPSFLLTFSATSACDLQLDLSVVCGIVKTLLFLFCERPSRFCFRFFFALALHDSTRKKILRKCIGVSVRILLFRSHIHIVSDSAMCSYMAWMFSFSCERKLRRCWLLHERCILFRHVQSAFHPRHAQLCPVDVFQFAVSTTSSQFSLCVSFAHCQLAASWNLTFDIFKVCVTY